MTNELFSVYLLNNSKTINVMKNQNLVGKHFIAQAGVNGKKIALHFKYRGEGINQYLKAGDVVKVIDESIEIDTPCVSTLQMLNRMTKDSFLNPMFFLPIEQGENVTVENVPDHIMDEFISERERAEREGENFC